MRDATEIIILFADGGRDEVAINDYSLDSYGVTVSKTESQVFYPWSQVRAIQWNGKRPRSALLEYFMYGFYRLASKLTSRL